MKEEVLGLIIVICLLILFIKPISAEITGTVNQIQEGYSEDIQSPLINATLIFYFNNTSFNITTNVTGGFLFNPNLDVYNLTILYNNEVVFQTDFYYNTTNNETLYTLYNIYGIQNQPQIRSGLLRSFASSQYPQYHLYHGYYLSSTWVNSSINISKRPLLLVHGWDITGTVNDTTNGNWSSFETELKNQGFEVWRLQYYPANLSNIKNAGMINSAISELLDKGYNKTYDKVDVVSHSMGSLVVRGYIQNLGKSSSGFPRLYNNNIRDYVIIAGPMYGTYMANLVNDNAINNTIPSSYRWIIDNVFGNSFISETTKSLISEATYDLEMGSNFTWNLNSQPINKDINYLTIAGNNNCIQKSIVDLCLNYNETNDLVVPLRSANLLKFSVPLIILNYNHMDINREDKTGKIVASFIKNDSVATMKSYLDPNKNEVYIDPNNPVEMSNIAPTGWILIDIKKNDSSLINNIQLKKNNILYKLIENQRTGKWFYLYPENGVSDINNYRNYLPSGNYSIYLNQNEINKTIEIDTGQVTLYQICLPNWTLSDNWGSCQIKDTQYKDWIDTNICNDNTTKPIILTQTCNFCTPNPVNSTFSDWQNQTSCLTGNYYIQNRSKIEFDANYSSCFAITNLTSDLWNNGLNNTYWDFRNQTCCISNLINTSWSDWYNVTTCNTEGNQDQARIKMQYDSNSCGIVQNQTLYDYRTISCNNLRIMITSPQSHIYNITHLNFNLSTSFKADEISYIDYSTFRPVKTTLCTKCNGYGDMRKTFISFNEGWHNLTFFTGNKTLNQSLSVIFLTDQTKPTLSRTIPISNSFINSSTLFSFAYTETNPNMSFLYVNSNSVLSKRPNNSKNDSFVLGNSLNQYNGQTITYYFTLMDIAGNIGKSNPVKVNVDTISPRINNFNYTFKGTNVNFYFNISELNFNKISYVDYNSTRSISIILCSTLNKGICNVTRSFSKGQHTLGLTILDKAGNSVQRTINFTL